MSLRVLHVARECAPLAKAGGLGDVVGALPGATRRLPDAAVSSVLLPCYDWLRPLLGEPLMESSARLRTASLPFRVLRARQDACSFTVLLVEHEVFSGPSVYGGDELARDVVLSAAALELAARPDLAIDLLHVHDHHAALACTGIPDHPAPPPRVLTVHNARYHGTADWEAVDALGLADGLDRGACDHDGRFNRLKAALLHADVVSTVSPTHARDLVDKPEASLGLDYAFRLLGDRFVGILNGIDLDAWDPASDAFLDAHFARGRLAGKAEQKRVLCAELHLDPSRPLLAFVGRLVPEKGVDALASGVPTLLDREPDAQVVVLGTGEPRYEEMLRALAAARPDAVRVAAIHDERFAHRLYASADVLLMPSWHEPCGLSQMYALRNGTVPVVFPTGGLRDSVEPFDPDTGRGTGAWMGRSDGAALAEAAARVLSWKRDAATWSRLVDNAMAADNSWGASAARHVDTYRRAVARGRLADEELP